MTWHSVVKLAQSLYREAPGLDPYRPPQKTPVSNFFLAGSYTQQDYIDSMEGATISGKQAAAKILEDVFLSNVDDGIKLYLFTPNAAERWERAEEAAAEFIARYQLRYQPDIDQPSGLLGEIIHDGLPLKIRKF